MATDANDLDAEGWFAAAERALGGLDGPVDLARANACYGRAEALGHARAGIDLGIHLIWGYAMPRDRAGGLAMVARHLPAIAAGVAAGHPHELLAMSSLAFFGLGVPRDWTASARLLERAALAGDGEACWRWARALREGWMGVPRDTWVASVFAARAWAAMQDDPDVRAQGNRGLMQLERWLPDLDTGAGLAELEAAAARGCPLARYQLASQLTYGDAGVARDPARARATWEELAALGHPYACDGLACVLWWEEERDVPRAARLFHRAAEAGILHAQQRWAVCLRDGLGTPRDPVEAGRWWQLAGAGLGGTQQASPLAPTLSAGVRVPADADLAAAIAAAPAGATLQLEAGTYGLSGPLVLARRLTLAGAGVGLTRLVATDTAFRVQPGGQLVLEDLALAHRGPAAALEVVDGSLLLERCQLHATGRGVATGVVASGHAHVTAREVDVAGWRTAMTLHDDAELAATFVRFVGAHARGHALCFDGRARGQVATCGFDGLGAGVRIAGEAGPSLVDTLHRGMAVALAFHDTASGLLEHAQLEGCTLAGVSAQDGATPVLIGSRVEGGRHGLLFEGRARGEAGSCTLVGAGIVVHGEATPALTGNRLCRAPRHAIAWLDRAGGRADQNMVERCGGNGLHVASSGAPQLIGNTVRGAGGDGLAFRGVGGLAQDNVLEGNGGFGLHVQAAGAPRLEGNVTRGNARGGLGVARRALPELADNRWEERGDAAAVTTTEVGPWVPPAEAEIPRDVLPLITGARPALLAIAGLAPEVAAYVAAGWPARRDALTAALGFPPPHPVAEEGPAEGAGWAVWARGTCMARGEADADVAATGERVLDALDAAVRARAAWLLDRAYATALAGAWRPPDAPLDPLAAVRLHAACREALAADGTLRDRAPLLAALAPPVAPTTSGEAPALARARELQPGEDLQMAVLRAPEGATLWLAPGDHVLPRSLVLPRAIALRGSLAGPTRLSASTDGVVEVHGHGRVTLADLALVYRGRGPADILTVQGAVELVLERCSLIGAMPGGQGQGGHGLVVTVSARVEARDLRVMGNGGTGIFLVNDVRLRLQGGTCRGNGRGLVCFDASDLHASGTRFEHNTGAGAEVNGSARAVFDGCSWHHNGVGLLARSHGRATAHAPTCHGQRADGMRAEDLAWLDVHEGEFQANGGHGLAYVDASQGRAVRNQLRDQGGAGLLVAGSARPVLEDNVAGDNAGGGLVAAEAAAPAAGPGQDLVVVDEPPRVQGSKLIIEVGLDVMPLVDPELGGRLMEQVLPFRRALARTLGVILPGIQFLDNMDLRCNTYRLRVGRDVLGDGELLLGYLLAFDPTGAPVPDDVVCFPTTLPGSDAPAAWIPAAFADEVRALGFTVWTPLEVAHEHIQLVLARTAGSWLDAADVQLRQQELVRHAPAAAHDMLAAGVNLPAFERIQRLLLLAGHALVDLELVAELAAEAALLDAAPAAIAARIAPWLPLAAPPI